MKGQQCTKVREWYNTTGLEPGHSEHVKKADAFLRMCEFFEDTEDGLYTLGELQQYLKDVSKVEESTVQGG